MKNTPSAYGTSHKDTVAIAGKQRSFSEIVEYLNQHWTPSTQEICMKNMKALDEAFGGIAQKTPTIVVTGSNGKSLTAHFTAHLLGYENFKVSSFLLPHFMNYNEHYALNNETISTKLFTDLANEVIGITESLNIQAHSLEIMTVMALLHAKKNNANILVLEVDTLASILPSHIITPSIVAVSRVTHDATNVSDEESKALISKVLTSVKQGTYVVSADQSKLNLQIMQDVAEGMGGIWAMPTRKLAQLQYPFEQLHGRCAALAERISHIYLNNCLDHQPLPGTSLITKQKGQRGRPTHEAKRQLELNPKKTIEQFWKETKSTLPGRFQLLDREKPSILLDSASNLDALKNVLLGIRLLHYQRPLEGLTLILGFTQPTSNMPELLRVLRYFFKKTSGQILVCPVASAPSNQSLVSMDVEKFTNDIKSMKIKAKATKSFKEAFEIAQKSVDERHGLVVITGSTEVVAEYWHYKGIKKLA